MESSSGPERLFVGEPGACLGGLCGKPWTTAGSPTGEQAQRRNQIQASVIRQLRRPRRRGLQVVHRAQLLLQCLAAAGIAVRVAAVQRAEIVHAVAELLGALADGMKAGAIAGVASIEPPA